MSLKKSLMLLVLSMFNITYGLAQEKIITRTVTDNSGFPLPGVTDATATVTIPEGTLSSEWYFPGDWYGEISFSIYSPAGNLIASYGIGTSAQVMLLNLCGE